MGSSPTDAAGADTSSADATRLIDVAMPQMGVSVAEGTIVQYTRKVGETIAADETICEVSTDKIDTELPSPATGVLAEILVPVGETVAVGAVLARIAASAERAPASDPAPAAAVSETAAAADPPSSTAAPRPAAEPAFDSARRRGARRRYSPVVQRIAAEHGIDLERVSGSGRDGRVRKQDVVAFLKRGDDGGGGGGEAAETGAPLHIESPYRPDPVPAPAGAQVLSRMRRSIGEHMKRSLDTAATCTTWAEADMSRIERARAELRLTALPLVARCAIDALREHPSLNARLEGERFTQHEDVNLGVAVSLGEDGLIVPVVHRAQELSAEGLGARIKDLAGRARARELAPEEVRGGTFTITNPGQLGSIMATPVINQPQVAILDLEAVVKRPVVIADAAGDDAIAIRPMTILGLSWDHRALDGALSARFLATLRRRLEGWR